MKIFRLLFLVLIILPLLANSQTWIQKGSIWHYDYWNLGEVGFYKLNYDRDTMIEGHNCQIITDTIYKFYGSPNNTVIYAGKSSNNLEYTYNKGDSIFFYRDSTFYLLYDFGANIGDSWLISNDTTLGCQPTTLLVTDTGHISVNNKNLRWIYIESNAEAKYFMSGKVIETIGFFQSNTQSMNTTLFPREVVCDSMVPVEYDFLNFKCYNDSSGLVYNPSGEDCEYYWVHQSINNAKNLNSSIKIFPNPTSNNANFRFSSPITEACYLYLYSSTGKQLVVNEIQKGITSLKVDLSNFNSGIYYYKIVSVSEVIGNGKILIIP